MTDGSDLILTLIEWFTGSLLELLSVQLLVSWFVFDGNTTEPGESPLG
jgi:hypothetical protein